MDASPLTQDLKSQGPLLKRFLWKGLLLLVLFLATDRLAGYLLRVGLDRYYGLDVPAQVLCVGHSQTVLGIDKPALEKALGIPVAKFAIEGANTADRQMMIRYYLKRQPKSVRAVIYGVDAHTFTGAGLSSSSYTLLFPFIDDPEIGAYIRQNCASAREYWLRRILCTPRYNELTLSLTARGYLRRWTNFKSGTINVDTLRRQVQQGRFRRITFDEENVLQFEKMADFVIANRVKLLLIYIPTIDIFNQAEPENFQKSIRLFSSLAATNAGVVFLNYNPTFEMRHELFRDAIHLNRVGQQVITAQLAQDLKQILNDSKLAHTGQEMGILHQ